MRKKYPVEKREGKKTGKKGGEKEKQEKEVNEVMKDGCGVR